ncbi:hypothetical protein WJX84_002179 [Apatococcus fuscideae]|uniref:Poly [ADP-ribose] polymerase n=1 Tax=Apatococcus fuscideae TaxID=2026836 RepID=A0AAW1RE91_9CHLO
MKDEQVKCIERVRTSNDLKLFHGAGKHALEAIINEGFDIRVANAGSLGQGTYFAQKSTYSTQFSQKPHQAALKAAEDSSWRVCCPKGHQEQRDVDVLDPSAWNFATQINSNISV